MSWRRRQHKDALSDYKLTFEDIKPPKPQFRHLARHPRLAEFLNSTGRTARRLLAAAGGHGHKVIGRITMQHKKKQRLMAVFDHIERQHGAKPVVKRVIVKPSAKRVEAAKEAMADLERRWGRR